MTCFKIWNHLCLTHSCTHFPSRWAWALIYEWSDEQYFFWRLVKTRKWWYLQFEQVTSFASKMLCIGSWKPGKKLGGTPGPAWLLCAMGIAMLLGILHENYFATMKIMILGKYMNIKLKYNKQWGEPEWNLWCETSNECTYCTTSAKTSWFDTVGLILIPPP